MKEIQLTRGYVALVDDEDFERVSELKWHAHPGRTSKTVYAYGYLGQKNGKIKLTELGNFILRKQKNELQIDHINRNGLDNRKQNLRIVTRSENLRNRGFYRKFGTKTGIYHVEYWAAQARIEGKLKSFGTFKTEEEAVTARKSGLEKLGITDR